MLTHTQILGAIALLPLPPVCTNGKNMDRAMTDHNLKGSQDSRNGWRKGHTFRMGMR